MIKKLHRTIAHRVKNDNENGARRALIEDLFFDFHKNRHQVYWMNFVRGLFFGLGTVLGGTLLIAFIAWMLSFFVHIPGIGNAFEQIQQMIQSRKQ